ncbi:glycosyltransferase [Photobacterium phosphoreum]|uniref:glycosyltransferase n=1 Tax=Photobacterium phosphoreum TaxID=659 RepID=UPI002430558F|nr:glycosyltransferase [Photobacterium phosphoreum]
MKTIVHVITKSEVGGAQTWVRDQTHLLKSEFRQIIITNNEGWLSVHNYADKVYFVKEIEYKFSVVAFLKILNILVKEKADIVISSSANAGLYARLAKLFYKHRSIYVSHGWSCIYNGGKLKSIFIGIEKKLSYFTDVILCVSDKDANNAKTVIGIPHDKIKVIRNAVYPQKEKLFKSESSLKLLFVGRLTHPKRLDLLIDAVDKMDNVFLTVVGDGPNRDFYKKSSKVEFIGEIKNFNKFYKYDAFTLISDSEGLPMSALEAASAGLPLLLSNVGGCSELIKNNGLLVDNTIESIINAINDIKDKYDDYQTGAQEIKNTFNLNYYKNEYSDLYIGTNIIVPEKSMV